MAQIVCSQRHLPPILKQQKTTQNSSSLALDRKESSSPDIVNKIPLINYFSSVHIQLHPGCWYRRILALSSVHVQYEQRKITGEQILRARSAIIHMGQRTKKYLDTTLPDTMSPQSNNYVIPLQMALELKSTDILLSSFQVACPCLWESITTSPCPYKLRRNRPSPKPLQ